MKLNENTSSSPSFKPVKEFLSRIGASPKNSSSSISNSAPPPSPSKGLIAALSNRHRKLTRPQESSSKRKVLVTITVLGSTGRLRFLVDVSSTVEQLITVALRAYAAQGRLPLLGSNVNQFDLYCNDGEFIALSFSQSLGTLPCRGFLLHKNHLSDEDAAVVFQPWTCWRSIVCSS